MPFPTKVILYKIRTLASKLFKWHFKVRQKLSLTNFGSFLIVKSEKSIGITLIFPIKLYISSDKSYL